MTISSWKIVFTNVIDGGWCNCYVLLLPRVSKLGKWPPWHVMNQFAWVRDDSLWPCYTLAISSIFVATTPPLMDSTPKATMSCFEAYILWFLIHSTSWTPLDIVLVFHTLAWNILDELQIFCWDSHGMVFWYCFFLYFVCVNVLCLHDPFHFWICLIFKVW